MFSPPEDCQNMDALFANFGGDRLTADDYILCSIQDLDGSIGMPHSEVSRVQDVACKQLARSFGVLVVALGANIARKDNLALLETVALHVNNGSFGQIWLDNSNGKTREEPMALPRHLLVFLF